MKTKPFSSILVDVDATASAQPALDRAARIARLTGARLRIVDVVSARADTRRHWRVDLEDDLMRRRREQLARMAYAVRDVAVSADVLPGPPAVALVRDVLRFGHDLVVRSHARDLVADGAAPPAGVDVLLLRHCPCAVWSIGPGVAPRDPKIVGAIDVALEDPPRQSLTANIVEAALTFARLQAGSLTLLNAWRPAFESRVQSMSTDVEFAAYLDNARRAAKANLATIAASYGARLAGVRLELRRGDVQDVVPQFAVAEGADLVVIGTLGRSRFSRLLMRSTAERLLRKLTCSIVAVKPPDFVSPVRC